MYNQFFSVQLNIMNYIIKLIIAYVVVTVFLIAIKIKFLGQSGHKPYISSLLVAGLTIL